MIHGSRLVGVKPSYVNFKYAFSSQIYVYKVNLHDTSPVLGPVLLNQTLAFA